MNELSRNSSLAGLLFDRFQATITGSIFSSPSIGIAVIFSRIAILSVIINTLSDDQLIDIAVKTKGNDYICALAIDAMKDQESLRKVLQFYHRFSPFRIYMWEGEKLIYTDRPVGMSFERGGLAVWVLLQRIDREHFKQAWYNCAGGVGCGD